MIYSKENKDDLEDLEGLADLQSKVKKVRLVEKLGKQGFQYDAKELFQRIRNAVTDTIQKLLEETKSTAKAIEALEESNVNVKALELLNKIGVIHSSLIRPKSKLLAPTNKSQLRFYEDPDSDNWIEYVLNEEKVTLYDDKILFENIGKVFTWTGDAEKMITDYNFITTDSSDAKLIVDFRDEILLDKHSRGTSLTDRNL